MVDNGRAVGRNVCGGGWRGTALGDNFGCSKNGIDRSQLVSLVLLLPIIDLALFDIRHHALTGMRNRRLHLRTYGSGTSPILGTGIHLFRQQTRVATAMATATANTFLERHRGRSHLHGKRGQRSALAKRLPNGFAPASTTTFGSALGGTPGSGHDIAPSTAVCSALRQGRSALRRRLPNGFATGWFTLDGTPGYTAVRALNGACRRHGFAAGSTTPHGARGHFCSCNGGRHGIPNLCMLLLLRLLLLRMMNMSHQRHGAPNRMRRWIAVRWRLLLRMARWRTTRSMAMMMMLVELTRRSLK
mmetsp:Transcript_32493/g.68330  ORF Transcript_32493/g.68330 Transcript_32493/m.68330 type:complete len:302 (-) Transcript_32493:5-910(-)